MFKTFLLFLTFVGIILFQYDLYADGLTGIKIIPGDYPTIEAAITDLNSNGVGTGGVIFNVSAGYTETFTVANAGHIITTGTSANPIVFQKSGLGANPLITAALGGTGVYDGIIVFAGSDYVTFDGIDVRENSGNLDATTQMEWGYALLKLNKTAPSNGCQYVTIKNSAISLNRDNALSIGIYSTHRTSDGTFVAPIDPFDATRNSKIFSNIITNTVVGIRFLGNTAYLDQSNEIGVDGANSITYGGTTTTPYGIEIEYQNLVKIANNILTGNVTATGSLYGVRSGSGTNCNGDFYGNTISLSSGSSSIIYSMSVALGGSGTNNSINIYNNIFENSSQSASTTNSWWVIYYLSSAFNVNIYGNIIRNITKVNGPLYCMNISGGANLKIYNNQVYNISSGGSVYGMHITAPGAVEVYNNNIYNLLNPGVVTSTGLYGISVGAGPVSAYIYNNFVSDLQIPSGNSADAIRGISLTNSTANTSIGLYYNTILLKATSSGTAFGTSGIYHSGSSTATTSALDMRNNIVVNLSTPNGTGKTAAYRRSSTSLANYSSLSNNNSLYSGPASTSRVIFYDGTNFDQTIDDYKTRMAPREGASINENVPFVNSTTAPFNLHVRTDVSTETEGGGQTISSPLAILTDFDGENRHLTKPDIGADEFDGLHLDITAPYVNYALLDPTISTSNRILSNVVITDGSGINVTPGTAPRIYFKKYSNNNTYVDNTPSTNGWKYVESTTGSSPFEFTINYALLFGGSGVQNGDTIQYFVVAQDLASTPNIGIFSGDFNSPPTSVNLTAAAFPLTGTINFYRVQYYLNGTVSVGPGTPYPSLTGPKGLFAGISENFVSGNLTVLVTGDLTETGEYALNQWVEQGAGNYTVTIRPDIPQLKRIAGSYTGGLIRINGADRVTFDGSYSNNGNYLEFQNIIGTANTATIQVMSLGIGQGVTNLTIQNCIIKGGINTVATVHALYIAGATISTSGSGADNNNITIRNNIIQQSSFGLYARGTAANPMNNLLITGNIIGSDITSEYVNQYGMNIQAASAPVITNNEVYNMNYDISKWGIYFGSDIANAIVSKNKVHSISQPGTTGYNSVGIYFSSGTGCSNNQIDNNVIYDLNTYGATSTNPFYLSGIRIVGGTNYKVYYNSVSITGAYSTASANIYSACLYVSGTASSNMDVRNNIFSNTRTGITPKGYTVYAVTGTTFENTNYNDYYSTSSVLGFLGSDAANLAAWKVLTAQDANSISGDPLFVNNTNLHITNQSSPAAHIGVTLVTLATDIDGDTRKTPPDIGADEFSTAGPATFPLSVDILPGWNMVSVPGLLPTNQNVNTWWSGRNPLADVYTWVPGIGFVTVDSAQPKAGYWMLHILANNYNTGDEWPAGGIQIVDHSPISVASGWNMIGGYETSPLISSLTTTPPGIIVSNTVYGWNGTYFNPTNLVPGYGYWVLISSPGVINIPSGASNSALAKEDNKDDWGKITISDASGKQFTLYSVKGEVDLNSYLMPPLPPAGCFDVRFASGRKAEDLKNDQAIQMTGLEYPVKVKVDKLSLQVKDETGKLLNKRVKAGEVLVIDNNQISKISVSQNLVPEVYSLGQNYPNPFNPSTMIEFTLPEDVADVTLTVYDALGQKVAELVRGAMQAGYYQFQWNASSVASGLYIYQLRSEKFVSTKKMMLLK